MQQDNTLKDNRENARLCVKEWPWYNATKNPAPGLESTQPTPGPLGTAVCIGPQLDVDTLKTQRPELLPKAETKLYQRRWIMLLVFSAVSACNAFIWLQYGIIGNIFMRFYDIDSRAIDWLGMTYLLAYLVFIVPVLWLLEIRGLREVVLVGSALNCIGTWIKIGSASPNMFPLTVLGQCVCSVAAVFFIGLPSYLASVWFGETEVSTACSIGVMGNQVCLNVSKGRVHTDAAV